MIIVIINIHKMFLKILSGTYLMNPMFVVLRC